MFQSTLLAFYNVNVQIASSYKQKEKVFNQIHQTKNINIGYPGEWLI